MTTKVDSFLFLPDAATDMSISALITSLPVFIFFYSLCSKNRFLGIVGRADSRVFFHVNAVGHIKWLIRLPEVPFSWAVTSHMLFFSRYASPDPPVLA